MPARGGSKRIPRKNLKNFFGEPIIIQTLQKIKSFDFFDRFIISTEDDEIINVASKLDYVEIPFKRPEDLATDHISTKDVLLHSIKKLGDSIKDYDYIFCLYPTAILVEKEYLIKAKNLLESNPDTFVATAARYPHPVERAFALDENNYMLDVNSKHMENRTQDFVEKYYDAGMFYGASKKTWLKESPVLSLNTTFIKLPALAMVDIDIESDWKLLEKVWTNR
jgi:N-acylneuraminate cytidylyltransferase